MILHLSIKSLNDFVNDFLASDLIKDLQFVSSGLSLDGSLLPQDRFSLFSFNSSVSIDVRFLEHFFEFVGVDVLFE